MILYTFIYYNGALAREARSSEIDALGKAKDVLSGADYSFLQASSVHRTRFLRRA